MKFRKNLRAKFSNIDLYLQTPNHLKMKKYLTNLRIEWINLWMRHMISRKILKVFEIKSNLSSHTHQSNHLQISAFIDSLNESIIKAKAINHLSKTNIHETFLLLVTTLLNSRPETLFLIYFKASRGVILSKNKISTLVIGIYFHHR